MAWAWDLSPTNGGDVSLWAESAESSPLSCTNRMWDLWVHTIAYVESLFHSLFPFPFFLFYTGFGSPDSLRLKRGIM